MKSKVLIFNPRYNEDIPLIFRNSDGRSDECTSCSENGDYCPQTVKDFFYEIKDSIEFDALVISEKFWIKNYDKTLIDYLKSVCRRCKKDFLISDNYSELFAIGIFDYSEKRIVIGKEYSKNFADDE